MESCTKAARWRLAATRRASRHEVFLNSLSVSQLAGWLRFPRTASRVLISTLNSPNFHSGPATCCETRGINIPRELNRWILRGSATDREFLVARISRQASKEDFGLIVLDPLYNLLGVRSENAPRHGRSYERNRVRGSRNGRQSPSARTSQKARGKESMDRISGSGVFARDPDTIMRMTRHKVDDAFARGNDAAQSSAARVVCRAP